MPDVRKPEVNELADKIRNELQLSGALDSIRVQLAETAFKILLKAEADSATSALSDASTPRPKELNCDDDNTVSIAMCLVREFLKKRGLNATSHLLELEIKKRSRGEASSAELVQISPHVLHGTLLLTGDTTSNSSMLEEVIKMRFQARQAIDNAAIIASTKATQKAGDKEKSSSQLDKSVLSGSNSNDDADTAPSWDKANDVIEEESEAIRGSVQFPGLPTYEEAILTRDFLYVDVPELLPEST